MQNAVEELVGVDFNTTSLHLIFVSHVVQNLFHFGKKKKYILSFRSVN